MVTSSQMMSTCRCHHLFPILSQSRLYQNYPWTCAKPNSLLRLRWRRDGSTASPRRSRMSKSSHLCQLNALHPVRPPALPSRRKLQTTRPVKAELIARQILSQSTPAPEKQVLQALRQIGAFILDSLRTQQPKANPNPSEPRTDDASSISALLALDASSSHTPAGFACSENAQQDIKALDHLSRLAYQLLLHPPVFITPNILLSYVTLQSTISRPTTFPRIFQLYAAKPVPRTSLSFQLRQPQSPRYVAARPNSPTAAIPSDAALAALDAALRVRLLPLALSIIECTFGTNAFRTNKMIRRAVVPAAGACLTPAAAYSLSANLAAVQTGLAAESFIQIAFAGMITYTACVATIGWVAVATANDQMHRVTWAEGMPLRQRWLREEERAAVDKVACSWGFQEKWRWGEEEGQDWDDLREWAGLRGMVLDKVSLMEGME